MSYSVSQGDSVTACAITVAHNQRAFFSKHRPIPVFFLVHLIIHFVLTAVLLPYHISLSSGSPSDSGEGGERDERARGG